MFDLFGFPTSNSHRFLLSIPPIILDTHSFNITVTLPNFLFYFNGMNRDMVGISFSGYASFKFGKDFFYPCTLMLTI